MVPLSVDGDIEFVLFFRCVPCCSPFPLLHDPKPYPNLVTEIAGELLAREYEDEYHLEDVTLVLHLCGTHLLSQERAHLFSVAHKVELRFVSVNPVETRVERFATRGSLVQDEVHPVLMGGKNA